MRALEPNATLVERRDLHEGLAIFRIAPDESARFDFEPGQFTNLALPGLVREPGATQALVRAYSIASAPDELPIELLIGRIEGGRFTTHLWSLPLGARLWMDPRAHGSFTLREAPEGSDLALVATGTGVAPFVSMLRRYAGTGRWRRLALLEGARRADDLAYRDEIERIVRSDPSVAYVPSLTREPEGAWRGARGRVHALLEPGRFRELAGFELEPRNAHVFLCGNPDMIREATRALEARGFRVHRRHAPGELHAERFW